MTTADAVALLERLLPVVVFLLAITVVAGAFDTQLHQPVNARAPWVLDVVPT